MSRFSSHFKGTPGIKGTRQLYLMGRRNECSAQGGRPWPLSKLEGRGGQEGRCATSFIWPANGAGTWRKTVIAVRDPLRSCLLASVLWTAESEEERVEPAVTHKKLFFNEPDTGNGLLSWLRQRNVSTLPSATYLAALKTITGAAQ